MELTRSQAHTVDTQEQHFTGQFAVGASGAVGAATPVALSGVVSITKVGSETGRYALKLYRPFNRYKHASASFVVTDDSAAANTTGESGVPAFRVQHLTSDGTILLQCRRASDNADADVTSGTVISYHIIATDA